MSVEREVLPSNVVPSHYALHLWPNNETFVFRGTADISLNVNEESDFITLNTKELAVESAKVKLDNDATIEASEITFDETKERCTFKFPSSFTSGSKIILSTVFTGQHTDAMNGFYRSGYTDAQGNQKYLLVTQFEATDARKAFPCFDEPSLKATYDVTLSVKKELTALSNMNVIEEQADPQDESLKVVKFATTPIVSSYLIAFAVGELDYIEASTTGEKNGKPIVCRVYTVPGFSQQGQFALDCCTKTLEYFAGVFDIPYPLPKMDMIAVPDFDAGAMENWGLVTYRTVYVLFDEKTSSASSKREIAYTVSHELAHQWFGNLVTMKWWDELWLNEGFATWVGWLATDHMFPEWDVWTGFQLDELQYALNLDAMRSSHPIQVEVQSAAEINQIFDAISYSKGGSVIRMLSTYLGRDIFLAGVSRYLKRHTYSNASTHDLWAALSEESGKDVGSFMEIWTTRIGFPVLTVTDGPDADSFTVKQNRFLTSGDVTEQDDETLWWAPLAVCNENGLVTGLTEEESVLHSREATFKKPAGEFYKLNYSHTSVYRVKYTKDKIEQLAQAVKDGKLAKDDRIGLLADAGSLVSAGIGATDDLLQLIRGYAKETEYQVWEQLGTRIGSIRNTWFEQDQQVQDGLAKLDRELFGRVAHELGWQVPEGEDYMKSRLRQLAIEHAGLAGDEAIVAEAKARFAKIIAGDDSAVHPDLRANVLSIAVKYGGEEEWNATRDLYISTTTEDQKLLALEALGLCRDEAVIQKALQFAISEHVRPQDIFSIFGTLNANSKSRYTLWNFIKENWAMFSQKYEGSLGILGFIVKVGTRGMSSDAVIADVESFFADKDTKRVERPLQQSLEQMRISNKWVKRDAEAVAKWIAAQS